MEKAPKSSIEMTVVISNHQAIELQGGGIGNISRSVRFDAHPENEGLAQRAEADLVIGLYHEATDSTDITRCGDGRRAVTSNGGLQGFGATAGEVKTKTIAGVLDDSTSLEQHMKTESKNKISEGRKVGAHRADCQATISRNTLSELSDVRLMFAA